LLGRDPPRLPDRDSERTRLFAEAVKEVASETGSVVVDTWGSITAAAAREGGLPKYLSDGLHLNAAGYQVVVEEVTKVISTQLPELHWDALAQIFPHWADIPNNDALGLFAEKK